MQSTVLLAVLFAWAICCGTRARAAIVAPAEKATCKVRQTPLSNDEIALSREDFPTARHGFESLATSAPDLSRNGVLRVLLAENKLDEAGTLTSAWLTQQPANAAAMESTSEFLLRDGRIPDALGMALKAFQADPCNARAHLVLSSGARLSANFALAAQQATIAHALDPQDMEIRRAWIATLPRAQRMAEYLGLIRNPAALTGQERKELADYLEQAAAHQDERCHITSGVDATTIPLETIMHGPNRMRGIELRVQLNGKKRLLELDSGASGLLLTRGAARTLGLITDTQTETGGIGEKGAVATGIARIASIRIGNLEFSGCPVRILEKSAPLEIDGLIGADIFSRYLITIDFPGSALRLAPLPKRPDEKAALASNDPNAAPHPQDRYIAPEMKDWTRIFRQGHDLLLPVSIGESRERLFIVDTGAGTMLISPAAARSVTKVRGDSYTRIQGISGEVGKVYSTSNFVLRFAHLEQKVDSMTAIDTSGISHHLGVEVSGFLGSPVLRLLAMHIDYRDNLIKFDYTPQAFAQPRPH